MIQNQCKKATYIPDPGKQQLTSLPLNNLITDPITIKHKTTHITMHLLSHLDVDAPIRSGRGKKMTEKVCKTTTSNTS